MSVVFRRRAVRMSQPVTTCHIHSSLVLWMWSEMPTDGAPGCLSDAMTGGPGVTRRAALRLAGTAGLALATGCTATRPRHRLPEPTATGPSPTVAAPTGPVTSAVARPALDRLSTQLSSPLLRPGSAGYVARVGLYDPRFDAVRRPVAIAACRTPADVVACVRAAADGGPPLHLRAGGHSYGGWSSGPGLVADVRPMASVAVDRAAGTARIGAGTRLAEVYDALGRRGVALAAGSCPSVGLTGLALGGGVGVLTRAFGLTCDAIRSVQLVTADGVLREVGPSRDPDLFWALRGGGGGSLGAVTALTVAVRPAPTVHTFFLAWGGSSAAAVLSSWQAWMTGRDRRLWSTCKLLSAPARGSLRAVVAGTWLGDAAGLDAELSPLLRAVGPAPRSRSASTLGYAAAMQLEAGCPGRDPVSCLQHAHAPASRRPFAGSSVILRNPLPPAGVEAAVAGARRALEVAGIVEGGLSFDALGGAVDDLRPTDTAFVHRGAIAIVQSTATWARAGDDPFPYDTYVRGLRAVLVRWTGPAAYVNYADPSIRDYGRAYWGANLERLSAVKRHYDPAALFTFPQAVPR